MSTYALRPNYRCPTCNSRDPHLHPATAFEGEVEVCADEYHLIPTASNTEAHRKPVLEKRAAKGLTP
ncbi:hypothetical protein KFK14_12865 [Sphingobium phenoxybenzoativorans]|uniref:Uncharacterized protein n=1 Tax=Sphingobium phenoxybenzoativorans TaxID=1592790 RepID=A0A975K4M6_9SPHN|nr:hypothetical protein [Sphingobium phenoxybenzoativorans]QUT04038.1 hypothetical protein KFK14_12865 [Sphingobium phenoxybenzoativorans]